MEKFELEFIGGGYVRIYWQGVLLSTGRPWITNPRYDSYSELLQKIWNNKECWVAKPIRKGLDPGIVGM